MVSLPPAAIRPLGCFSEGWAKARALNQSEAWTDIVSSYEGGCGEVNDHCLTVLSLDAERMVCLEGKATARTCADQSAVKPMHEK